MKNATQLQVKFQQFVSAVMSIRLVSTQTDIAKSLTSSKGRPITPPGLVQILRKNNGINVAEYHFVNFEDHFPFTKMDYFDDNGPMIRYKELIAYLCDKAGITKVQLAKKTGMKNTAISYLNNQSEESDLQVILDYFNDELDMALNAHEINQTNLDSGYSPDKYAHTPMVYRLKKYVEYLKNRKVIESSSDFAKLMGVDKGTIYRVFHSKGKLEIPRTMLVKLAEHFDELDFHWLLTGKGTMHLNRAVNYSDSPKEIIKSLQETINKYMLQLN